MSLDLISIEDNRWPLLVESFEGDIFYQREYCQLQQQRVSALPLLLHYQDEVGEVLDVAMEKQVSTLDFYNATPLTLDNPVDVVSAEYNGPIIRTNSEPAGEVIRRFRNSVDEHYRSRGVVTEFVRFHPFVSAVDQVRELEECVSVSEVIYIDLTHGYDAAKRGYRKGHRAAVTKALRNGVAIRFATPDEKNIGTLASLYTDTMRRRNALAERARSEDFFECLFRLLGKSALLVEARLGDATIVSAVFLLGRTHVWHMYAGSNPDLKSSDGGVLLLDRVALWAAESGYSKFVLGGGWSLGDSTYSFKRGFSHLVRPVFQLRKVHNSTALNVLMEAKTIYDNKLGRATPLNYFPAYWLD